MRFIPEQINGSLLRIGPAKWDFKNFTMNHWLDGSAMVVKFRIENGNVYFSSKFLDSDAYRRLTVVNKPVFTEFGTRAYPDPCKNLFARFFSQIVPSDLTDNDISNIYQLKDEIYVATESCNIWRIDSETLDSIQKVNLDKLVGVNIASSHPHYSDGEGCSYNLGSSFLTGMRYHIVKIPTSNNKSESVKENCEYSNASIVTTIPSSSKTCFSYNHSFAMTEKYVIIIEQPLLVNGFKLATCTPKGKALVDCLEWHADEPARFHVIEKESGERLAVNYQSEAFFFFHVINAYEEDDHVIVDLIAYEDATILTKYELSKLRGNEWDASCPPAAKRFVLPLQKQEFEKNKNLVKISNCGATATITKGNVVLLTPESLGPKGFELPVINYKSFNGRNYRYVYGSGVFERGFYSNSICKLDVKTKKVLLWKDTETSYPGETVFIPRPTAVSEDDGFLLSVVLEVDPCKSHYLLVMDAQSFTEMGRAYIDHDEAQVPPTIHGLFLD
ncbi:Retinal pigment epithelial membrane-like protein [Leptotrombidium deliense]|uniref:Retinal pigment epithelial membrane-like protein n=1 Tax=Leptotrombidium deliense TaxID=299467 RepID=A0A443ST98_9ACAR|nr:Retinal pigment epithelial membrane-like protein [Leptotrombidium deliense]